MAENFGRHRQAKTADEVQKLHLLATRGISLKAISKAMTRSAESIQARAKIDKLKISKMRQGGGCSSPNFAGRGGFG